MAAAELLIALRTIARDRVDITLLCPQDELTYRPLSVVAPFGHDGDLGQSIDRLASDFDARRVKGSLAWVAPSAHTAYTDKRERLHYDVLVVATGARREAAFQYGLTFRGLDLRGVSPIIVLPAFPVVGILPRPHRRRRRTPRPRARAGP